jgi:hypothetical protein
MHEMPLNQAAGLIGLARPAGAQLLAMVSHGDDKSELPLLWRLCTAMTELGYAVTVLDATKTESEANPGLQQLMDYRFGYGPSDFAALHTDVLEWTIVPSAQGIQSLCHLQTHTQIKRMQSLHRIGQLFPSNGVVILYAGVDAMVQMLGSTGCRPLLTVTQEKSSLLTSYLALKRLLIKAGLRPAILNMMAEPKPGNTAHASSVAGNLVECAKNFLGYEVNARYIDPHQPEQALAAEMRRLSMRMLENALMLSNATAMLGTAGAQEAAGPMSRSH